MYSKLSMPRFLSFRLVKADIPRRSAAGLSVAICAAEFRLVSGIWNPHASQAIRADYGRRFCIGALPNNMHFF
jgi:hypothetical protein